LPSEAFWTNEGVCQVGEQEQGHAAAEDIVEKHVSILRLKNVAGFDVGEGKGEEQNPYPENDDIHRACSLSSFYFRFSRHTCNLQAQTMSKHSVTMDDRDRAVCSQRNMDPIAIKVRDGAGRKEIGIL